MRIKEDLSNLVLGLIEDKTIINSEVTVLGNITIEKIDPVEFIILSMKLNILLIV